LEVGSDFQLTSYFHFEVQTSNFPTSDFQRQTSNFLQAFLAPRISSDRGSRRRSRIDQICPHVAHPRYTKLPDGAIATAVGRLQFSQGVFLRMTGASMIRLLIHPVSSTRTRVPPPSARTGLEARSRYRCLLSRRGFRTRRTASSRPLRAASRRGRETAARHGSATDRLNVGVHVPGCVAQTTQEAADAFLFGLCSGGT
jgi:hypothetical protein